METVLKLQQEIQVLRKQLRAQEVKLAILEGSEVIFPDDVSDQSSGQLDEEEDISDSRSESNAGGYSSGTEDNESDGSQESR